MSVSLHGGFSLMMMMAVITRSALINVKTFIILLTDTHTYTQAQCCALM